jgi:hypothetical protein
MATFGESSNLPQVLVSDAEREMAHELVKRACLDGRLTLDELGQRVEQVETARTRDELSVITRDLRAVAPRRVPESSSTVAIMSQTERVGRWRVAAKNRAIAVMGSCKLDLRGATISAPVTTIRASVLMGELEITVPENVAVELETLTIMGERKWRQLGAEPDPDSPLVRVTGFVLMGSVKVISRHYPGGDRQSDHHGLWRSDSPSPTGGQPRPGSRARLRPRRPARFERATPPRRRPR